MAATAMRRVTFPAMGTAVTVLIGADEPIGAVAEVRDLFAGWEAELSRFRSDSDLSRLNARAGQAVRVSPLLFAVTETARAAASATNGAFDPLLGRQIAALGYGPAPAPFQITAQRPLTAPWRRLACDAKRQTVTVPYGCSLDLGGIAKGMAVDAAAALLRASGVHIGLVNAGGDMRTVCDGTADWQIGFDDAPGERIGLEGGAVATSSRTRRTWLSDGRQVHHLLDPATGQPAASGLTAVSVAAATCAQAEVAAKAAFVMGPGDGSAFIAGLGLSGLLVHGSGAVTRCGAWPTTQPDVIAA